MARLSKLFFDGRYKCGLSCVLRCVLCGVFNARGEELWSVIIRSGKGGKALMDLKGARFASAVFEVRVYLLRVIYNF